MTIKIDVAVEGGAWGEDYDAIISKVVHTVLETVHFIESSELSVVLADDGFVQDLNKKYRGQDKTTNVLSFSQDEDFMLGDIVFAFETVSREAVDQRKSFADHFSHLIVHGVLHLLGHDHEDEREADAMETLEIKILSALGIKNPYAA